MTNGIQNVGGTITGIVGLGITLGALGLALEFVDRSFDRATPQSGRRTKRKPLFDTSYTDSIFDMGGTKPKRKGKKQNNMYGDFF